MLNIITHHEEALTHRVSESRAGSLMRGCKAPGSAGRPCTRRCCTFDNRGIGSSSIPEHLAAYKTGIMAADVRALMDHLGWARAHVMGMSLGGEPCNALHINALFHRATAEVWRTSIVAPSLVFSAGFITQTWGRRTRAMRGMGLLQHASGCRPHSQPLRAVYGVTIARHRRL